MLASGEYEYGWFGGRANGLDDHRHVAFAVHSVMVDEDCMSFRFDFRGAVVTGRFYGRSFTGVWRQSDDNFKGRVGKVFGGYPIANLESKAGSQCQIIDRLLIQVGCRLIQVRGEDEQGKRRG